MTDPGHQLDDALRRVPLPDDLRAALTPEALFADTALNRLLAAVAVPEGLADRVRSRARSGAARSRDGVIDLTRLADARADRPPAPVLQPGSPGVAGRRLGGLPGLTSALGLAHAAGRVAAALGLVVMVAAAGIEVSRRLEGPATPRGSSVAVRMPSEPAQRGEAWSPAFEHLTAPRQVGRDNRLPQADVAQGGSPAAGLADEVAPLTWDWDLPEPPEAGLVLDDASAVGPPRVRGAAISPAGRGGPPTLTVVAAPGDTRRLVPQSAAYDVAFEMAHGESPFVNPAADPGLAVDRPPLTLRTEGFDLLLRPGGERRPRGLRDRVRVEEVLAAMPAPESLRAGGGDALRLGLFAVRSGRLVGGKPTVLLEAAAFAAGEPGPLGEPLAATLILDRAAVGDPQTWPRICRGLAAVAEQLAPDDRVSVVLCGPRPRIAIRDADPAAFAAAARNWEALPPAGSCDLDAALEAARAAGLLDRRAVIVAHAVTLDRGRGEVRDLLASWHRGLALTGGDPLASSSAVGPRFVILDPAVPAPARGAGPTFGRTSPDASAIRRELLRQVTGRDTLVARQCRLEVRFDPGRVAGYRLVGHRQSVVESLATDEPPTVDLHAGETVRAVYEVIPRNAAGIGLATAALVWRTADGAAARLEAADREAGDRTAAVPSPYGCELLLATTLGELVGGSVHTGQPRAALARLAAVADRWQARGDLTPFGATLVQEVERRGAGPRAVRGR